MLHRFAPFLYGPDSIKEFLMRVPVVPLLLLALSSFLCGCSKKETGLPPPTAEAIAAFAEAAFNGETVQVAEALKNGMPVDQMEENGNTALMLAAFNGHTETMKTLLAAGAEVDLRDTGSNRTALMFAASGPFPAAVRLLLENGADVNAVDGVERFTPLMFAAAEGLSPVVDILLEHGADPAMKDKDDDTAASFAKARGFTALADTLQALIHTP
jgi:ankyrin repeat protein